MRQKTNDGQILTGTGRWIAIRFYADGTPYFIHYGHRFRLDCFLRFGTPWGPAIPPMWEEKDGLHYMSGIQANRWDAPLMVELDECCDRVRVWQEAEKQ